MRHLLRILSFWCRREFMRWLVSGSFLLTLVINQALTPLIGLMLWSVALPGNARISTYYVVLLAVQLLTVSYEDHTFAETIYLGTFSHDLLRPQPVILGPLGTNLALRFLHLLTGMPLLILAGVAMHTTWDVRLILLALPAVGIAAILRFLFTFTLSLSGFWTQQAHGIVTFGETLIFLLGGSAVPIAFFPSSLRLLGEALPFRALLGFPAEIMSSSLDSVQMLAGYLWQIFWLFPLLLAAMLTWRAGLRRFTAVGG